MSPEFMSENFPTEINNAIKETQEKPTEKAGSHPAWVMDDWRKRIRNAFIDLQGASVLRESLKSRGIIKAEPPALSGQFEKDAETALKRETKELEAEGPTRSHLYGERLDPFGLTSDSQETDEIKPAA